MAQNLEITKKEFELFKRLIYDEFGISLSDQKITLVQSRLRKWILNENMGSFKELYEHLLKNTDELVFLADAITTNVTSFFREEAQWVYLKSFFDILQKTRVSGSAKKIRIWSAGCSSGQEPYTIAIFLKEHIQDFANWDIKILATDLSNDILKKASAGIYRQKEVEGMPKSYLAKYFNQIKEPSGEKLYQVKDELKELITFRSFNLVTGNFGIFKNKFDLIFCRNVMIYFDKPTQNKVVENFLKLLEKGSLFLIGHSESLTSSNLPIKLVSSSIYEKRS